ncbi:Nuclear transport factor 2, partial [Coniosporium uncinatum]
MGDFASIAPIDGAIRTSSEDVHNQKREANDKQRDHSMLTFESAAVQGAPAIIEKLTNLPFQKIKHQVATLDAQPSSEAGGILVLVTGALLIDEEQKPMSYVQTFQLMPENQTYFVFNDVFKLVYPAS